MMKLSAAVVLVCLVSALGGGSANGSPVVRVVQLLNGLSTKLQDDAKAEKDIFERFECWYNTIVNTKSATNSQAQSRIDSLTQYVDDITAGKIEFTNERANLELQINGLQRDIANAKALREKQRADFEDAQDEMQKAIAALSEAIDVLKAGTTSLMQIGSGIGPELLNVKTSLRKVLSFGRFVLDKKDARFLMRVLDGDVPTTDWKKLNRKATFKKKYVARSTRIQQTLLAMEDTFKENLASAEAKESQAQTSYDALMMSKEGMLKTAEDALVEMVEEHGARNMSQEEAENEIADLKAQIEADKRFMREAEDAYKVKSGEYEDRRALRMAEIKAVGQAIEILHGDDNRDTFKRSFTSQGYLFLQHRPQFPCSLSFKALGSLWSLAAEKRDAKLALIAQAASAGRFDKVLEMVDKLLEQLKGEEGEDLQKKELCEKDIAENTREAAKESREIDDTTDAIAKLQTVMNDLEAQIGEQQEFVKGLEDQIAAIDRQRDIEKMQFEKDLVDDERAVEALKEASKVLKDFYSKHGLALSTERMRILQQPFHAEAGKAPPPPPTTWENPSYGGAVDEQQGIVAILAMVLEDVQADIKKSKDEETSAITAHESQKKDLEDAVGAGTDAIDELVKQKAEAEEKKLDKEAEKKSGKAALEGVIAELKSIQPGCDYFTVNFLIRAKKRQIEIDGLNNAKAILNGANFEHGASSLLLQRGRC